MKKVSLVLLVFSSLFNPLFAKFYMGIEAGYNRSSTELMGTGFLEKCNNSIIGTGAGVGVVGGCQTTPYDEKIHLKQNGVIANIVLGTEHFWAKDYFGLRWGIYAGYGSAWGKDEYKDLRLDSLSMGLSFDLIGNFVAKENLQVGFVGGVEYAYILLNPNQEVKISKYPTKYQDLVTDQNIQEYAINNKMPAGGLLGRVGITSLINKHHRIEVLAKIPFSQTGESVGYHFTFTSTDNGVIKEKFEDKFNLSSAYKFIQAMVSYKYVF